MGTMQKGMDRKSFKIDYLSDVQCVDDFVLELVCARFVLESFVLSKFSSDTKKDACRSILQKYHKI